MAGSERVPCVPCPFRSVVSTSYTCTIPSNRAIRYLLRNCVCLFWPVWGFLEGMMQVPGFCFSHVVTLKAGRDYAEGIPWVQLTGKWTKCCICGKRWQLGQTIEVLKAWEEKLGEELLGGGATWGSNDFENPRIPGAGCVLRKDFRSP